jgi:hypothetical protein
MHPPSPPDQSLLYRELFNTKAQVASLEKRNPFERQLASMAVGDDRALQAQQLRADESVSFRGRLAPVAPAERLGLDVGTIPFQINRETPVQERGTLGFTQEERPSASLLREEALPSRQSVRDQRVRMFEDRTFNLKTPPNTLQRALEEASSSGHSFSDESPPPATLEEARRGRAFDQALRDQLAQSLRFNPPHPFESPDRRASGLRTSPLSHTELPVDPLRATALGSAGTELQLQRDPGTLEAQLDVARGIQREDEGAVLLDRAEVGQGEGLLGEEASADRQATGQMEGGEERGRTGARRGRPPLTPEQRVVAEERRRERQTEANRRAREARQAERDLRKQLP